MQDLPPQSIQPCPSRPLEAHNTQRDLAESQVLYPSKESSSQSCAGFWG